jgi:hypothetical protein
MEVEVLTYMSMLLGLTGGILGLTGKAWDESHAGWFKFTRRGTISLGILLLGFLIAVYSTFKTSLEKDHESRQRLMVRKLAYDELEFECRHIMSPFEDMLFKRGKMPVGLHHRESSQVFFDKFVSVDMAKVINQVNVYDRPESELYGFTYDSYHSAFKKIVPSFRKRLRETVQTYSFYLEGEDIVLVNEIIRDSFLTQLENLPDNRKTVGVLYLDGPDEQTNQKECFTAIKKLWTKVSALQVP